MGVILGELMESNLRRAMTIYDGEWLRLLSSNVAITIWVITILGFILPFFFRKKISSKMKEFKK